jgi:hypothetical protein
VLLSAPSPSAPLSGPVLLHSAQVASCPWFSLPGPDSDDAPGFVGSLLPGGCTLPLLAPCFTACSSLLSGIRRRSMTRSLPVARAAAASPVPLIRHQVMRYPPIGREAPVLVPPLVALPQGCCGGGPLIQADRLTSWTDTRSESGVTGRESQACRAVNKSIPLMTAKQRPPPSAARASPKRSGRKPRNTPPQAEPSQRANASSGRGRRPPGFSGCCCREKGIDTSDPSLYDRAGRRWFPLLHGGSTPGSPVTLSYSLRCIAGSDRL